MRSIVLLCALLAVCSCLQLTQVHAHKLSHAHEHECTKSQFEAFKSRHGKLYTIESEESMRFGHFCASLARAHMKEQTHGTEGVFGITQFADLSNEEFRSQFLSGFQPEAAATIMAGAAPMRQMESSQLELPESVDWRLQGMVTEVNNQGQCGSCWAFSAVETVESAFMQTHPAFRTAAKEGWGLSVQEVVDCTNWEIFGSCHGAWAALAYDLIKKQGIVNATDDPYTGNVGTCTAETAQPITFVSSYAYATPGCILDCSNQNMTAVQAAVANYGPLSICLDAEAFQDYTGGILPASSCSDSLFKSDHCIQLVGYSVNTSDPSQSYWLARNSWGTSWGLDGYIHMEMGDGVNTCGMGNMATTVELVPDEELDTHREKMRATYVQLE